MALTKETEEIVTILPDGKLEYLLITKIMEDGVELSRNNWRAVYEPDQDINDMPPRAYHVAAAMWTPEVIDAFKQAKAEREIANQAELASATI